MRVSSALRGSKGADEQGDRARLFLSPKTVEFHLGRAYGKLDVRSRAGLIKLFAEQVAAAEQLPG
jgi:hypothetical protein